MNNNKIIGGKLSHQILMSGNYYKNHHPGGISAVVQYWADYIEDLRYFPTFKEGSKLTKIAIFVYSYTCLFFTLMFDRRVKIIHTHTAAGPDFWRATRVIELAKRFKKKTILHSHASQFKVFYASVSQDKKDKIINTLKSVDVLIALSNSWKEWFIELGINPDKIVILHNITAYPTFYDNLKSSNAISFEKRPVRFLFMGEIGQRKGIFDIIRGLDRHRNEINGKLELRIGGNKMESELRRAIAEAGLSDCVRFEGWVSGDKKIELMNWADVYILPSFNEGLPISILEAMSYKMPIISTPVGGIPEVVDTTNGILITPGNDEEIYTAMKHYVDCREDIVNHGNISSSKAKEYLPDFVLHHLKQIYEDLL